MSTSSTDPLPHEQFELNNTNDRLTDTVAMGQGHWATTTLQGSKRPHHRVMIRCQDWELEDCVVLVKSKRLSKGLSPLAHTYQIIPGQQRRKAPSQAVPRTTIRETRTELHRGGTLLGPSAVPVAGSASHQAAPRSLARKLVT